ncbi:NDT80 DNA-binding domain [Fusarium oxysporum f. sp. vasinfectum]|nr:NDT80 DNA-binding domain [Fusarium oxysporum f. sp. vasinfectum]
MSAVGDELAGYVPETYLDFVPTQASILYGSSGKQVSFRPSARLGGVFLIAKESLEGGHDEDVLTCYRRNLFSIAGVLSIDEVPTWSSPLDTARDPSGHEPKIPGANSTTERGARPADIPLIPPSRDGDPSATSSEHLEIRFSWERLQFRSATANNGKRRKEIRQQFKVIVLIMTSKEDGSSSLIAELGLSFLTVRGRSPKSFAVSEASQISALDAYWPENDVIGLDMHLPASSGRVWTSAPEVSFLDPYSSYMISDPS